MAKESADKIDQTQKKYNESEKGKRSQKKYHESEKYKIVQKNFRKTEKSKLIKQKYNSSTKGKKAYKEHLKYLEEMRKASKWLDEHPGKTIDDYTKELSKVLEPQSPEKGVNKNGISNNQDK